jgi:CheY-like chemotaxis protein
MKNILLIEDESFIIDMYQAKLESSGLVVHSFFSISDAEKALYQDNLQVDLILLDLILPDRGGIDFLRERYEKKDILDVPVIVLSNLSSQQDIDQALKFGAVDFIVKSNFTPAEVVQVVFKYLDK